MQLYSQPVGRVGVEGHTVQFMIDVGAILGVHVQVGNREFEDLTGRGDLSLPVTDF